MKVVIADDEYLAQQTLISMIRQTEGEWEIVGVANNGFELIDIVREQRPAIAFVDIKMPGMNGIEAIGQAKLASPDTHWFILSGYSEFTYAQNGIKLGVLDYLLKPVSFEELNQALTIAKATVIESFVERQKKFENSILNHYYRLDQNSAQSDEAQTCMQFHSVVVFMDSCLVEVEKASLDMQAHVSIASILKEAAFQGLLLIRLVMPNGHLAIVGASHHRDKDQEITELFDRIQHIIEQHNSTDFKLTMISAQAFIPMMEIQRYVNQIREMGALRMLKGIGKCWNAHSFQHFGSKHYELCEGFERLVSAYVDTRYSSYIEEVFYIDKFLAEQQSLLNGSGIKGALYNFLHTAIGCNLQPEDSLSVCMLRLKEHGERLLLRIHKDEPVQDIVQKVIYFMKTNYMHDIGTTLIAEHFNISPNYLSTVFHQKMGVTLIKYLTELRVHKAKEILAERDVQIQEAAELVGYLNPSHFANLFKRIDGRSPTEFKQQLKGD